LLARLHGDPAVDLHPVLVIERDVEEGDRERARAHRVAALAEADFLMGVRLLPLWERSTPLLKSVYATHILMADGNAHYLTLRLGRERLEIGARNPGGLKAHCRREIQRRLSLALGRPVEFWFTLEGASSSPAQRKVNDHLNIVMAVDDQRARDACPRRVRRSHGDAGRR
jgi:hypothetical protein